jgi:hypothetical protein
MATQQPHLHCVTCDQPLPEGKEPEYFASTSIGYTPETEAERAAEDVSQCVQYAQTVNSAVWDMLRVAKVESPELMEGKAYLKSARSLCFLLTDLVEEVSGRVKRLSRLIDEKVRK